MRTRGYGWLPARNEATPRIGGYVPKRESGFRPKAASPISGVRRIILISMITDGIAAASASSERPSSGARRCNDSQKAGRARYGRTVERRRVRSVEEANHVEDDVCRQPCRHREMNAIGAE